MMKINTKRVFALQLLVMLMCGSATAQRTVTYPDVHDPVLAYEDGTYYMFTTGNGVGIMKSEDNMQSWQYLPGALRTPPQWAVESVGGYRGHTWAPDIYHHDGIWYLYYSCSSFGKNESAIGVATNTTLNPSSPAYKWEDQGAVVRSFKETNWNAIDPNLIMDKKGNPWLTWGSFWDGIQIVQLEKDFITPIGEPKTIARRYAPNNGTNNISEEDLKRSAAAPQAGSNAIEAPFIIKEGKYYYMFVSWDYCCKGLNSNYKVVVGRSKRVDGPYLDKDGVPLNQGGGTLLLGPDERYAGIGHCSVYDFGDGWRIFCHAYDKQHNGASKLFTRRVIFDSEGWPFVAY